MTEQYPLIKKWLGLNVEMGIHHKWVVSAEDLEKILEKASVLYMRNKKDSFFSYEKSLNHTHMKIEIILPILSDPRAQEIESIKNEIKKLNERLEGLSNG